MAVAPKSPPSPKRIIQPLGAALLDAKGAAVRQAAVRQYVELLILFPIFLPSVWH